MNVNLSYPYGIKLVPVRLNLPGSGVLDCNIEIDNHNIPIPNVDVDTSGGPMTVVYLEDNSGNHLADFSGFGLHVPRVGDTLCELPNATSNKEYLVTQVKFGLKTCSYVVRCKEVSDEEPSAHKQFSILLKLRELLKLI